MALFAEMYSSLPVEIYTFGLNPKIRFKTRLVRPPEQMR